MKLFKLNNGQLNLISAYSKFLLNPHKLEFEIYDFQSTFHYFLNENITYISSNPI